MRNLYHRLLLIIAGSTQKELAAQIRYLKVENQILRSKLPARIAVTPQERNRLVKFGCKLGKALGELVTIVHSDTLRRWIREAAKASRKSSAKKGRPRTKDEIRELILKLARENNWGYTRILGELRKLDIQSVSRNTVKNILREYGLDPGPQRGPGTWDEFLKLHAATLWQCDFFSKRVLTPKGFRDLFVLIFLHVETRRVFATPSTYQPNESWVCEQAKAFRQHCQDTGLGAEYLLHDRDTKFTAAFDESCKSADLNVIKLQYRSPNTNAYVERFIQTLQHECLDYFIVFGEQHMDYLVREMVEHYLTERPHRSKNNQPLLLSASPAAAVPELARHPKRARSPAAQDPLVCDQRLGGLLKHYRYRRAA